jgi:hypothetical protein
MGMVNISKSKKIRFYDDVLSNFIYKELTRILLLLLSYYH